MFKVKVKVKVRVRVRVRVKVKFNVNVIVLKTMQRYDIRRGRCRFPSVYSTSMQNFAERNLMMFGGSSFAVGSMPIASSSRL